MKAGRELDALVAEKVMGGYVDNPDAMADKGEIWYWLHPKDGVLCGMPYKVGVMKRWDHQWHKWKPSTDIAAAWQVVERFKRPLWVVTIYQAMDGVVAVSIRKWENETVLGEEGPLGDATSKSAPHAICLAALRAISS